MPSFFEASAIVLGFLTLVLVGLRRFRVVIADGVLTYTPQFGCTRVVALRDIERAIRESGYGQPGDQWQPFYRLRLVPKLAAPVEPVRFNIGILSRQDMERLYEALQSHGVLVTLSA